MTLDCIRHPRDEDYEFKRFQHMEDHNDIYGVWDCERKAWRSQPNYTCQEAATMSRFLNCQDRPGGLARPSTNY